MKTNAGVGIAAAARRALTITLGPLFFAMRRLAPQEFFGITFWLGVTLTAIGAEVWINVTRAQPLVIADQVAT